MNAIQNSHFMHSRDAFRIAFDMHESAIRRFGNGESSFLNGENIDEFNHYSSLFLQFITHNGFIDSCAFDSFVEVDNFIELQKDHNILSWEIADFAIHFKNDILRMHHFASLEFNSMHAMHNRDICIYCTDEIEMCCNPISETFAPAIAFTITDIF